MLIVLGGNLDGRDVLDPDVEILFAQDVGASLAVPEHCEVGGQVLAKVGRHDGRRRLGTKAEVFPGAGDGHPHEVAVVVKRGDHSGHDDGKHQVVAGGLVEGSSKEEEHDGGHREGACL